MLLGHRLFASSLTGTLFCVFLYPLLTVVHLAFDENVQFWIGYYPLFTLLIPLVWLCAHAYHIHLGKGNRAVVTFTFTFPCVVFFLVGGSILFQATHVTDGLLTADCAHFRAIRPVEQAYRDAATVLSKCQEEQKNDNLLLQHCKNYIDEYDSETHAEYWPYLQFVERNYNCHGFCSATNVGLWTRDGGMDACAVAVASVIKGRVLHSAWQLMLYSAAVMVLFLAWLAFVGNLEDSKARRAQAPLVQGNTIPVSMPA
jgi:hypothetical protein